MVQIYTYMKRVNMKALFFIKFIHFLFVCVCAHHIMHMEVRGQLVEVRSLIPPCGSQGLNSGRQAWWQALTDEPTHWSK